MTGSCPAAVGQEEKERNGLENQRVFQYTILFAEQIVSISLKRSGEAAAWGAHGGSGRMPHSGAAAREVPPVN